MTRRAKRFRPTAERLEGRRLLSASDLDTTFGGSGEVAALVGSGTDSNLGQVAVQADGKVVEGGSVGGFGLVRFNADGSLDASFGTGGQVVTTFPVPTPTKSYPPNGRLSGLALAPGGKVVAVGSATVYSGKTTSNAWAVARYNANGTLDTTFGGGTGKVTLLNSSGSSSANKVAIQSDGRIVVVGYTPDASNIRRAEVVRLNADGTPDGSFGSAGKVALRFSSGGVDLTSSQGVGVVLDAQGRIVVLGVDYGASVTELARLNPNGTPDSSFGSGGQELVAPAPGYTSFTAGAVGLQPGTGRLIVSGRSTRPTGLSSPSPDSTNDTTLVRLGAADGRLDTAFSPSGTGYVVTDQLLNGYYHAVQADGAILVSGTPAETGAGYQQSIPNAFGLFRVTADGLPDTTFGATGNGVAVTPNTIAGTTSAGPGLVALAADGRIVQTGWVYLSGQSKYEFAAFRYQGQAPTTTTLSCPATAAAGQPVTFTATVSDAYGIPTGTVEFYDGTTLLGTATLTTASGVTTASLTTAVLGAGVHSIRAVYDGDARSQGSASAAQSLTVS